MARFAGWSVGMIFCSIIARNVGFLAGQICVARDSRPWRAVIGTQVNSM
jgi:hypothetical protein